MCCHNFITFLVLSSTEILAYHDARAAVRMTEDEIFAREEARRLERGDNAGDSSEVCSDINLKNVIATGNRTSNMKSIMYPIECCIRKDWAASQNYRVELCR